MSAADPIDVDVLIIGGGFYGAALTLFLSSVTRRLTLVEASDQLMSRASATNQARIHQGFHYPRSVLTAVRSRLLSRRFAEDFPDAVDDSFQMLYAIARHRSKVTAKRFWQLYTTMGAPIAPAPADAAALFDGERIEEAFACTEHAFDYAVLGRHLRNRIDALDLDLRLSTRVETLQETDEHVVVGLSDGREIRADMVFNITYAQINDILARAGLPPAALKHELTEIALIDPPSSLKGRGVTVMDGPFFSSMPFPAEKLYSLTHVRYTPHESWTDAAAKRDAYDILARHRPESRAYQMITDARRFMPAISEAQYVRSRYEVKTVLTRNENDDGRPILFQRRPTTSRVISVLGGKIDNIYDLFALVCETKLEWAHADDRHLHARCDAAMPAQVYR